MTGRVDYDEFGLFHENAAEFGLSFDEPPIVARHRVEVGAGRHLSALVWGDAPAEAFLVHGGAQNAHTWDTVALALGRPLVAVDLPGHGHSDGPAPGYTVGSPVANASDLAMAAATLAPAAEVVVGMSLGGLSCIALAARHPDLVRHLVLVDITPGVTGEKAKAIHEFVDGPATFDSFEALLARTIRYNPGRSESSLRRGILHNAVQLDDGSWMWRHRRDDAAVLEASPDGHRADRRADKLAELWQAIEGIAAPITLVRGMKAHSVVDDDDVAELLRRRPQARVIEVADAGHSVQGDAPLTLAEIITDVIEQPI